MPMTIEDAASQLCAYFLTEAPNRDVRSVHAAVCYCLRAVSDDAVRRVNAGPVAIEDVFDLPEALVDEWSASGAQRWPDAGPDRYRRFLDMALEYLHRHPLPGWLDGCAADTQERPAVRGMPQTQREVPPPAYGGGGLDE